MKPYETLYKTRRRFAAERLKSARKYRQMAEDFGDPSGAYAKIVMQNMMHYARWKARASRITLTGATPLMKQ